MRPVSPDGQLMSSPIGTHLLLDTVSLEDNACVGQDGDCEVVAGAWAEALNVGVILTPSDERLLSCGLGAANVLMAKPLAAPQNPPRHNLGVGPENPCGGGHRPALAVPSV